MEKINEKREKRNNWICRYGLQIEDCRRCLFDTLCLYLDNKNKNENEGRNTSQIGMDNQEG